MACKRCRKPTGQEFCSKCLAGIVERRARKILSRLKGRLIVTDPLSSQIVGTHREAVFRFLPLNRALVLRAKPGQVVLAALSADYLVGLYLERLFEGKKPAVKKGIASLFATTTETELRQYAGHRKIRLKQRQIPLHSFTAGVEASAKGSIQSAARGILNA